MGHQVETLREEAQALLKLEQNLLLEMAEKGILDQSDQESDQDQATLDTQSVKKEIAVLRGELLKVTELEMVLAVVGTMKAGKSTAINAIVGKEILPNRNAPMTAIPTLIKHCRGKNLPHLIFTDTAGRPINQLIQDLKVACENPANRDILEHSKSDRDLYTTIEKIQNGMKMKTEALGEEQIFDFLSSMNDLVRVAPLFNLQFPFECYQDVDQLPVIEVEFAHLQEVGDQAGKLILLDTPGPNEAGQTHLRPMLQDQLRKASAVLAVMDYTQLKSEADAQIRDDLKDIANTVKNRIYALVNKFDNCDRNGMQKDEVKIFVEGLTEGLIKAENTYPVAAKFAYLANRARHERLADGALPDIENAVWVGDFYNVAGLHLEPLRTSDNIAAMIKHLWEKSSFSEPLKQVISASHQKAAFVALDSAVDKLDECSEKINLVLAVKEQTVQKSAVELQELMVQLGNDIKRINQTEINAKKTIDASQAQFLEKIKQLVDKEFNSVSNEIKVNIEKGQETIFQLEKEDLSKKPKTLATVWKKVKLKMNERRIDKTNPVIDFGENKKEAQEFIQSLVIIFSQLNERTNHNIEIELTTLLEIFEEEFKNKIFIDAQKDIQQINSTLNQSGFEDINLNLPKRKSLNLKLSSAKLMQNALIENSHQVTRTRVSDGKWAKFKNWFNDNWGTETYTETVREYKVDMCQVEQKIKNELIENQKQLDISLTQNIKKPLEDATKQFFSEFKRKVSGLRKDIENSLRDKELSKQNDGQFLDVISAMKKSCQAIKERTLVLQKAIQDSSQ